MEGRVEHSLLRTSLLLFFTGLPSVDVLWLRTSRVEGARVRMLPSLSLASNLPNEVALHLRVSSLGDYKVLYSIKGNRHVSLVRFAVSSTGSNQLHALPLQLSQLHLKLRLPLDLATEVTDDPVAQVLVGHQSRKVLRLRAVNLNLRSGR